MTETDAIAAITNLKDGESWTWPESDYGRAEIWLKNGTYFLFEIPMYGGEPRFCESYDRHQVKINELVERVLAWT